MTKFSDIMKKFYEENREDDWLDFDDRFEVVEGSKKEKNAIFKIKTNIVSNLTMPIIQNRVSLVVQLINF